MSNQTPAPVTRLTPGDNTRLQTPAAGPSTSPQNQEVSRTLRPTPAPTVGGSNPSLPTTFENVPTGPSTPAFPTQGGSPSSGGISGPSTPAASAHSLRPTPAPTGGTTGPSLPSTPAASGPTLPSTPAPSGPTLPSTPAGTGPTLRPTPAGTGPSSGSTPAVGPSGGSTPAIGPSGGSTQAGGPSGGSTQAGGPSGGSTQAGGSSGGSTQAGGPSGGSTQAGGSSGGSTQAGGPSGGSTQAGGPSGGSTQAGGPSGGSTQAGGPSGGSTPASGPSGGSTQPLGPSGASNPVSGASGATTVQPGGSSGSSVKVSSGSGATTLSGIKSSVTAPSGGSMGSKGSTVSGGSPWPGGQTSTMISGSWNSTTEKSVYENLKQPWVIVVMTLGAALFLLLFALLMYCLYKWCVTMFCPQEKVTRIIRRRVIPPEPQLVSRGQVLSAGPKCDAMPVNIREPAETFSRQSVKLQLVYNQPSVCSCPSVAYNRVTPVVYKQSPVVVIQDPQPVSIHETYEPYGGTCRRNDRIYGPTVVEISDNGYGARGDRANVTSYLHSGGYLHDSGDYDRIGGRSAAYARNGSIVEARPSSYNRRPTSIVIGRDSSW